MPRTLAYLTVQQHKRDQLDNPLRPVWIVAKHWGHGGYTWYAVTDDGALLCSACVRRNYRQIVESTRNKLRDGWQVVGQTYSGEIEQSDACADCGILIPGLED